MIKKSILDTDYNNSVYVLFLLCVCCSDQSDQASDASIQRHEHDEACIGFDSAAAAQPIPSLIPCGGFIQLINV
jgi:hypothetical protein